MAPLKLYAETPALRLRQVLLDAGTVVWVAIWVRVGWWLHDLVRRLEGPGRGLEDAGSRIAGWRVPLLRRELGPVTSGGEALQRAGETQQDAVQALAIGLGVVLAAIPIVWLLARYLPGRLRWAREATAAGHIRNQPAAAQLFCFRAIANSPLCQLPGAAADPAGAYGRGEYEALAALELARLGLRPQLAGGGSGPYPG